MILNKFSRQFRMNSIVLIGHAGRDPEVRYFESGSAVATLTIADSSGKRDEPPTWFNVEIWGKSAQVAADYVRKGSKVAVRGTMKSERWTDKQSGEERTKMVLKADRIELLDSKPKEESAPQSSKPSFTAVDSELPF